MKTKTLKRRILTAFTGIIVILSVCILALGAYVLKKEIFSRTQQQIERSLDSARTFYLDEIDRIGFLLRAADLNLPAVTLKETLRVDYLIRLPLEQALTADSIIVKKSATQMKSLGGTRIISQDELVAMGIESQKTAQIVIQNTPKARPSTRKVLESVMAKEYVLPIRDSQGHTKEVVYAGRFINRDYVLVDRIRKLVFGDELYHDKPVGTVTVFQDDVRVSTNVLTADGKRAIGTRVSDEVYREVVENGNRWLDRAFVVTDWYKTAYEPIRNIDGTIIGILYVGTLEEPFNDMLAGILLAFVLVILLASGLGFVLSVYLAGSIVNPITHLTEATYKVACGELGQSVQADASIRELKHLAESFNDMSIRLKEREVTLKANSEKMTELNKSYMDLLGFVAHELKGLLASAVINAYSLRDGYLGMINFKQKKAVDSICRNLDYLDATVRKFLNLSRIERGNLEINKTEFLLSRDVFEVSIQAFSKLQRTRKLVIDNQIDPSLMICADKDLMQIVANNLVNNAIKYGTDSGQILLTSRDKGEFVTIEVYNDSRPITEAMKDQLFKKFSRLDVPEKKAVKGSGLGLYITKQIVEAHGGSIRVEPRDKGNSFIFAIRKE
ncbi:MAG: cache domain-containing protein [Anaerohalosphaeraceae bacterium]|jgi:signal transduction histidine kinase